MKDKGRYIFIIKRGVAVFCLFVDSYKYLYYIFLLINLSLLIIVEILFICLLILINCL